MQELISQLSRLYLPAGAFPLPELERQLAGSTTRAFDLVKEGAMRAIVMPFDTQPDADGANRWEHLCAVANALQNELGLPAPAVSVSGGAGYRLWLSFEEPVAIDQARQMLELIRAAYCPEVAMPAAGVLAPVELPPCRQADGRWAAFIHPGMGASFADEPALEMAPPLAAQAAFLSGLQPISRNQLQHALAVLRPDAGPPASQAMPDTGILPPGLLLKDATLEDIVRFLHAKNIEPTFRHVLPAG